MVDSSHINVLILTATIKPRPGVPNLIRSDPVERLVDYQKALTSYIDFLGSTINYIVFVDNSDYNLTTLRQIAIDRNVANSVFFISFNGLDYPPEFDRGYGELLMLDFVMNHNYIISMPENTIFWKSTGRYLISNLAEIVNTYPYKANLYCNMRDFPRKLVDMYFMAWTKDGYDRLLAGKYKFLATSQTQIERKIHPEELLRSQFPKDYRNNGIVPRFSLTPKIIGFRAGDNKRYEKDSRWKYVVRRAISFLIPSLWI